MISLILLTIMVTLLKVSQGQLGDTIDQPPMGSYDPMYSGASNRYPVYSVDNEYYPPPYEDGDDDEYEEIFDPDNIDYTDEKRKPAMPISNWTYQDQENWERIYPECGGPNQSPINILDQYSEKDDITEIFLDPSYEVCCSSLEIKNTGKSVEIAITEGKGPLATGPFVDNEAYYFTQLHFHWGHEPNQGSEHAIDDKRFAMEMHFVHYNKKYKDFTEASTKPDGLVVLATLFEITEFNNPALDDIVAKLEKIKCGGLRYELGVRLNLLKLLPSDISKYYQYEGSLTTPPCSESVTWVVFKKKQKIGRKQITKFRKLYQDSKCQIEIGVNLRQLNPLNGRIVYSSTATNNRYPKSKQTI